MKYPGLGGSLAYIPLSLISLILAFQLPSGKHDACHLGSGDNSKVWLQTIQSLVINPSLSPCNFAIHPVLREAVSPSSFTHKRGKSISWGDRPWAGFWTLQPSANTRVRRWALNPQASHSEFRLMEVERSSIQLTASGCTHSGLAAQKRLCAKKTLIWITLKVKGKDCFISWKLNHQNYIQPQIPSKSPKLS